MDAVAEPLSPPGPVQRDAAQLRRLRGLRREGGLALLASLVLLVAAVLAFKASGAAGGSGDVGVALLLATAGTLSWIGLIRTVQCLVLPEESYVSLATDGCAVVLALSFAVWLLNQGIGAWF
ncbi:MAG: hypothetical protein KIS92_10870 [Planctomycetota bacterium]|nr:hypothetical protein [Planctomycetota bacterium]